jgi:hypothetical protein
MKARRARPRFRKRRQRNDSLGRERRAAGEKIYREGMPLPPRRAPLPAQSESSRQDVS